MARYILMASAALLAVIFSQETTANDEDGLLQKPIDISLPESTGVDNFPQEQKPATPKRKRPKYCSNSDQCGKGFCCLQRRPPYGPRVCRPMAGRYRRCGEDQVKSGYYLRHCPCYLGTNTCENGYCVP
uniref:Putative ixodegrins large 4 n=1 Tax=Amblyomma cajennense TaxID=34607 RepID=A0A023FDQ3_AMBCJ